MKKIKYQRGITLIALVITIIVMLILVAVTISVAVNGGLLDYAEKAASETRTKRDAEQDYANLNSGMSTEQLIDKYTTYGVTYTAYEIGDTVTIGGENFYVIESSDETASTVKLLAKQNVDINTNRQSTLAGTVAFDSTEPYSTVYSESTIKGLVDIYVASLGLKVQEARLMLKSENSTMRQTYRDIVYETDFWIDSPYENGAWVSRGDAGGLASYAPNYSDGFGVRPVIIISKSILAAYQTRR